MLIDNTNLCKFLRLDWHRITIHTFLEGIYKKRLQVFFSSLCLLLIYIWCRYLREAIQSSLIIFSELFYTEMEKIFSVLTCNTDQATWEG